jgi:hypothetical protein
VPTAGEARSPPLTPWSRAQAPALHFAPTRGQKGGRERRPGPTPASPCRAPPHFGVLAVAPRSHTSLAVGFGTGDPYQNEGVPLGLGPPWTRAPGARRGPRRTLAPVAVGSEIHGAGLAVLFKSL